MRIPSPKQAPVMVNVELDSAPQILFFLN
jgi:hypothetical protein